MITDEQGRHVADWIIEPKGEQIGDIYRCPDGNWSTQNIAALHHTPGVRMITAPTPATAPNRTAPHDPHKLIGHILATATARFAVINGGRS